MIWNQLETHMSSTGKSVSLKLSELGLNQGVVLGVTQYNELREQDGQYGLSYSNSFKYQKSGSNVNGYVWISLKESPAKTYKELNLQEGDYFRIVKVKPEGYKFHFYDIKKCDKDGNVQEELVDGPTVTNEEQSGPNVMEQDRIDKIRIGSTDKELTKDQWIGIFCKDYSDDVGRAEYLYENHK